MRIQIEHISQDLAERLCRTITSDLPEYFGLPDVNEHYVIGVRSRQNLAAKMGNDYIGLISIEFPYENSCNIYWMAVLRHHQGEGVGQKLIRAACNLAKENGATTMTVETLAPSESEENYINTYYFYRSVGFDPLFNLKPNGYEWNMVYMVKTLERIQLKGGTDVLVRALSLADIPIIVEGFNNANWPKPTSTFETYFQEQLNDSRLTWVAYKNNQIAGYVTLKCVSQYTPFASVSIPEIMDLNVLPPFRKAGIGSLLLDQAEKAAATKSAIVGLGVGLYGGADGGYGAAQKLYVNRGYIPDGKGVTYNYQHAIPGHNYPLDDDLVLWFTKKLG